MTMSPTAARRRPPLAHLVLRACGALTATLLAAAPLAATSYVLVADDRLADAAQMIARVEIEAVEVVEVGSALFTDYTALLLEEVKGVVGEPRLTLRVPGGRAEASGRRVVVWGAPQLRVGERALVFLSPSADGTWRFTHFMMGAFPQVGRGRDAAFVRHLGGEHLALGNAGARPADEAAIGRHSERFVAWLRDRAAGLERAPDYVVERPREYAARYTLLAPGELFRWFEFDSGGKVRWFRHRDGQDGLSARGKKAFRKARRAWRKQSGVQRLRLADAGTTASTDEFRRADFRNTILFDDRNGTIGESFTCEDGGVIAVGGFSSALGTARFFKGEFWFPIDEAEIIVNDGVGCLFGSVPRSANQVFAHELGHTLGLGHSCGDRDSPRCGKSDELDDALMRAFFHEDGRGARLGDDDLDGIRTFYDPVFYRAPCDLPPGHPRFCRRCGPCGEGQGNCRNNGDCDGTLVCARDVGADFGFEETVNVCVSPG